MRRCCHNIYRSKSKQKRDIKKENSLRFFIILSPFLFSFIGFWLLTQLQTSTVSSRVCAASFSEPSDSPRFRATAPLPCRLFFRFYDTIWQKSCQPSGVKRVIFSILFHNIQIILVFLLFLHDCQKALKDKKIRRQNCYRNFFCTRTSLPKPRGETINHLLAFYTSQDSCNTDEKCIFHENRLLYLAYQFFVGFARVL